MTIDGTSDARLSYLYSCDKSEKLADTRAETDRLFAALKEGGKVEWAPAEMPWGGYWGSLIDRFGNEWMFSCAAKLTHP